MYKTGIITGKMSEFEDSIFISDESVKRTGGLPEGMSWRSVIEPKTGKLVEVPLPDPPSTTDGENWQ